MADIKERITAVEVKVEKLEEIATTQTGYIVDIRDKVTKIDARNGRNVKIVMGVLSLASATVATLGTVLVYFLNKGGAI